MRTTSNLIFLPVSLSLLTLMFNDIILMHENGYLSRGRKVVVMKTQSRFMYVVKANYIVVVIALLGIFAFLSAILVAWPAIAYLASKLFG
jgi:hypothetical protein